MELLICANVFKPNLVTKSFYANPQGCLKGRYFVLTLWGSSTSLKTTVRFLSVYLWITGHRFQPFALPGFIDSLKYHEIKRKLLSLTLVIATIVALASCTAGSRMSRGGCHVNQGYVGYGSR